MTSHIIQKSLKIPYMCTFYDMPRVPLRTNRNLFVI